MTSKRVSITLVLATDVAPGIIAAELPRQLKAEVVRCLEGVTAHGFDLDDVPEEGPRETAGQVADPIWTTAATASYLRRPEGTLRQWRQRGFGPKGFRVGGLLMYRRSEVLRWLAEQELAESERGI